MLSQHLAVLKELEKLVDAGLKGLLGQLHDDDNDGWYPVVSAQGRTCCRQAMLRTCFRSESSIPSTCARTSRAKELLEKAQNVLLERFWDDEAGLSVDTWNTAFTQLDSTAV